MSVRERAMARTRSDIVEAAAALLRDEHPASITVPAVADRAGVSLRTVYRHFPTKADLLDATSKRFLDRVGLEALPSTTDELHRHLRSLWQTFADDPEGVKAEHRSAAGAELRATRLARARDTVAAAVERSAPDVGAHDRARLGDLVIAMTGSAMFLELVDRLGGEPAEAADTVVWAVNTLLAHAQSTGGIDP